MAEYGAKQYDHKEGDHNPLHSSTPVGHDIEGTQTISSIGTGTAHVQEQEKHNGAGAGSVIEKIKEKLPGGDEQKSSTTATVGGYEGEEGHEKKGLMEKIKDILPGSH